MAKISKFTEYKNLVTEFKSQELYHFLKENSSSLKFVDPYREGQSFKFGQNLYFNRHLVDFFTALDVSAFDCLRGFLFTSAREQAQSENNTFSLTDTLSFLQDLKKISSLTPEQITKIDSEAMYRLKFNSQNNTFILDIISPDIESNNLLQLEKKLLTLINKPQTLCALLESNKFDINIALHSYQSTLMHHWAFRAYDSTEHLQILKSFYNSGANPNLKNELGQSVLSLCLEQDKFSLAENFISVFLDKLDINEKFKGKTYFHMLILKLEKNATNAHRKNQLMNMFSSLLPLCPDLQIRSGFKNKGTTILSYIENKITDKNLSSALKEKLILEESFKSVSIKKSGSKFKL